MPTVHSYTDDVLGEHDAVALAEKIRSGEISAADVTEAAIARVELIDKQLNAVQFAAFDRARAQARAPLGDGPFAGVPSFVKDNNDVAGLPTCHGSAAITPHPAKSSYPPAAQFLEQGYVLLGKSTLPEFGLTASTEFVDREPTRNPWDPERSAGASSGGAAVLVASGAVPIAHANDGGGSIRIPAAVNGLVGLKPTRCRTLDQPRARKLPVNLAAEGVVSRSVRDTAHHLAGMELSYRNIALPEIGLVEGPSSRRLRIALITESVTDTPIHTENVRVAREAAELLTDLGHTVHEITPPVGAQYVTDFKLYWGMFAVLMSVGHRVQHGRNFDPRRLDPFTKGLAKMWARNAFRTIGALRRLRAGTAIYEDVFAEVDVVLSPTLSHPAPPIGHLTPTVEFDELYSRLEAYVGFTPFNNVGGGPAVSLPFGMFGGSAAGLPASIHVSAAAGDERTLLELAYEIEAAKPFPRIQDF